MTPDFSPADGTILLRLIFAHVVSDFLLQRDGWILDRSRRGWASGWLWVHGASSAVLTYVFSFHWSAIWLPAVVFVSHILFDGLKSKTNDSAGAFVLDQTGHLMILTGCWIVLTGQSAGNWLSWILELVRNPSFWTITVAYLLVIWPTGVWIKKAMAPWWKTLKSSKRAGLERAGLWIGRIERILVLTFVLMSKLEAIGFLITAKSILRFGELRKTADRKEAEYVLIGTMLSMGVALGVGLATLWLKKQIQ